MIHDVRDRRAEWWLLYVIALLLGGLFWLVDAAVPVGAARTVLETAVVIGMFALMAQWIRYNRVAIEVDEQRRRRARGVERRFDLATVTRLNWPPSPRR